MSLRIGCDTGGTFTDLVFTDGQNLRVLKVPSNREQPERAVLKGIEQLGPGADFELAHGTTVGTNLFLERKGVVTAFVTTAGFRDLLLLGRGTRPDLYALEPRRHPPLVDRKLCFEVVERLSAQGEILEPLEDLDPLVSDLKASGAEAVAVCLLFSFRNPIHELRLGERLAAEGFEVVLSSQVSPEYREYERASTTVACAYLKGGVSSYLERLDQAVTGAGCSAFWVVSSAGAVVTAAEAAANPATLLLSGPAAGVRGAFEVAESAGYSEIITLDMGGTSTDVALCPGTLLTTHEGELGGLPLRVPRIDLETVGAGGGSVAWKDDGGALQVGPHSVGADPGPAAYGRGQTPTVTDAQLCLGWLPKELAGGELSLDIEAARRAVGELADQLGSSLEETAFGILEVTATKMERALRRVSLERGYDPRRFVLVPFGGQGPLMACELTGRLELKGVLVPQCPGVLSALGAAVAPWQREFSRSLLCPLDDPRVEIVFSELEAAADQGETTRWLDLRYRGQGSVLKLPFSQNLREDFEKEHQRQFTYVRHDYPIEVVTLRVRAERPGVSWQAQRAAVAGSPAASHQLGWHGRWVEARLVHRSELKSKFEGPLVIQQYDTTVLLPPGWKGRQVAGEQLFLERSS